MNSMRSALDDTARHQQITRAADQLILAIESKPLDENEEIGLRAIKAGVKFVTGEFRGALMVSEDV